jgi:hypothetical protein
MLTVECVADRMPAVRVLEALYPAFDQLHEFFILQRMNS